MASGALISESELTDTGAPGFVGKSAAVLSDDCDSTAWTHPSHACEETA